jgi:hypothetical protein
VISGFGPSVVEDGFCAFASEQPVPTGSTSARIIARFSSNREQAKTFLADDGH